MIIATGSVNIDENTKLAEDASEENEEAIAKLKTTIDGVVTVSTQAPFNDGREHSDGDQWYIESDGVYTAMYDYKNGGWSEKQWDQDSLNVKTLSALTADLGQVNAGTINGVSIIGSSISGSSIVQDFTSNGTHYQMWADYNGFHYRVTESIETQDMRMTSSGFTVSGDGKTSTIAGGSVYSNLVSANIVMGNGLQISGHTIAASDSGALYLENDGGGGTMADIHAADVYSHGTKIKSALSTKRDVVDYDQEEALAAIMNTDIKKWKYNDSDNSANSQHIGPIIDDINAIGDKNYSIANEMISADENGNYFLNESNTISIMVAALQMANKKIDALSYRITQLERKNAQ